jgi:hypothetical protein
MKIEAAASWQGSGQPLTTIRYMERTMAVRGDISAELARQLLDYDPETGAFTWRKRRAETFERPGKKLSDGHVRRWNERYAGKPAGGANRTSGYMTITINKRRYQSHRLAWLITFGRWPSRLLDHINRDQADNRLKNLRLATKALNSQNRKTNRNNTSGVPGVNFIKLEKAWMARIMLDGKSIFVGKFKTLEAASTARAEAKLKYHPFSAG